MIVNLAKLELKIQSLKGIKKKKKKDFSLKPNKTMNTEGKKQTRDGVSGGRSAYDIT